MIKVNTKYNKTNEFIKYKFFEELEHSIDGKDPKTVDQYVNAIHEFEVANNFKDFKNYNKDWAIAFKDYLNDKKNKYAQNISKSYYFHYLLHVRTFFEWLLKNEKEYSKLKQREINFLGTRRGEKNQAKATDTPESHEIKDIILTIRNMPIKTKEQRRNKAMVSLYFLTSPRTSSLQQARIKSIRFFKEYDNTWAFIQDPRLQNTKFSKKITSFFIGDLEDVRQNILSWQEELIAEGWSDKDYLFPKITPSFTKDGKSIMVLQKDYIRSDSQIRDIVKKAFVDNGIKYLKPHTFRHSIAREVKKKPNATELSMALAENYGHKTGLAVLFTSYAGDYLIEQAKLVKGIELE
jgi:integrase